MKVVSSGPPATPRGRYRHVGAYVRLVVSYVAAVHVMYLVGQLLDGTRALPAGYYGLRYGGASRISHDVHYLVWYQPLYAEFYQFSTSLFTSVPFLAVLVGGLLCVSLVEISKRRGGRKR